MRNTATQSRHNLMWARDRLARYGVSWQTMDALIEAGAVEVAVEKELDTHTDLVYLTLQNNRRYPVRVVEFMNPPAGDEIFKNAIGPCILLASLPPVDHKD